MVIPGLLVLPGLLLILKQPDLGSGLSFVAVYAAMLLMVGVRSKALGVILLFSLMLFPFAWEYVWGSLHDYQRQRIMAFVDPEYDPGGKGYHALQSRIAIGSGELVGKGLYEARKANSSSCLKGIQILCSQSLLKNGDLWGCSHSFYFS